jgi:hypothetical protein
MVFAILLDRLREDVRQRVRNGEITERGLARRIGLSQSHTHNVLSGARILTPSIADRILVELGLSVTDLIPKKPPRKPALSVRRGRSKTGTTGY